MEVFEAIRTVLAVRQYRDQPVPPESVRRILEAGRLTGSAKNAQPWQFIVVENRDTLQQIGATMRTGGYVAGAPLAIVVVAENDIFGLSDASRAIQSMILAAWSEGIGSNWAGFPVPGGSDMDPLKPLLGIPESLQIIGVISFGYPARETEFKGNKRRKPLAEIAHRERFGQSFE
ncbi:MAG: nitroreductase family protein [Anaerolineae bacterium]